MRRQLQCTRFLSFCVTVGQVLQQSKQKGAKEACRGIAMAEISEHDVLMDVDESSWKTKSVGSWEGGSALMEPSILGLLRNKC